MAPSLSLALLAFLHRMRSLRRDLKSFMLRCLLLWPRILRNLRNLWSLYFQTGSVVTDRKKTGGDAEGPSSTITMPKRGGYTVICASRTFDRVGDASPSRSISRSGDIEESIERGTDTGRAPSEIPFPVSYPPSLQSSRYDSPRHSDSSLPARNVDTLRPSSSLRAGSPLGTSDFIIDLSPDPLPGSHPHATSRQFTGAYPHTRSRSPSPSLFHRRSPSPSARPEPGVDIPLRPTLMQESHGSPEAPAFPIVAIQPPSRSGTQDSHAPYSASSASQSRLSPVHGPTQGFPTRHNSPSAESVGSSVDSSRLRGHSPSAYEDPGRGTLRPHHIGVSVDGSSLTPPQIQGNPQTIYSTPQSVASRVFGTINASGTQPGRDRRTVWPMHPDQVSRYMKHGRVPRKNYTFALATMQVDLPYSYQREYELDSDDWAPITHPGGALYFYHKTWRIFTDAYMYNPNLRAEVYKFAEKLKRGLEFYTRAPFPEVDIVLDIVERKDKKPIWKYYYVDHKAKTLFWLQPYNMRDLLGAIPGVREPGHVKLRLESLYWVHWSLYPIGPVRRQFPAFAAGELLGILLSSSIDSLTSSTTSTAPYSVADMQTMYGIIKEAQELGLNNPYAINSIARLLSVCAFWRFVHFHGQETSRQHRHKSIYSDDTRKRTVFFQLLFSPALFFTPDVHLRELGKVWADELIIEDVWRKFMQRLVSEWEEFVLYSTVMLATNVAFLAIQGVVVVPPTGWIDPSSPQIASSISLLFSIGSIITGLLLIRRNRTMAVQGAAKAKDYLNSMTKPYFYLEHLAIMFSLTYALLMWSVCIFFVALLLFSFQNTKKKIQIPVGAVAALVTILIFWSIWNSWDSGDEDEDELTDGVPENID